MHSDHVLRGRRHPSAALRLLAGLFAVGLTLDATAAFAQLTGMSGPRLPRKQEEQKPKGPSGPVEQQFPFGSTWLLDNINGKPATGDVPSFRLDDKLRATGFGGCNSFSMALYPIKDQKLAAGAIATTKKTCGKDLDELERNLLVGLHSLPTWHLESNGDLTVKGQTGTMLFHRGL
jgi:heat shock protein HslJ